MSVIYTKKLFAKTSALSQAPEASSLSRFNTASWNNSLYPGRGQKIILMGRTMSKACTKLQGENKVLDLRELAGQTAASASAGLHVGMACETRVGGNGKDGETQAARTKDAQGRPREVCLGRVTGGSPRPTPFLLLTYVDTQAQEKKLNLRSPRERCKLYEQALSTEE